METRLQLSRHELDELDSKRASPRLPPRVTAGAPPAAKTAVTTYGPGVVWNGPLSVRCEMTRHAATDDPHIHTGERMEIRFASLHRHDPDERPGLHSRVTDWTPAPTTARQHSNKDDPKQKDDC